MAEKSRSLSFFLFVCALLSGVIFYGCGGGGGTSSQSVPLQISGNVTSLIPLRNLRADSVINQELRAASGMDLSGIEVYLESARSMYSTRTDSDGKFLLSGVPAGSHYLIARAETATGTILKIRSSQPVLITDSRPTVQVTQMKVVEATASASGRLLDVNGNPVGNGALTLWGETFYTDSNGMYTTPPMPFNTVASVVVALPGYQQTAIEVKFTNNPPFIEQTIVDNSATNRPPTSTLIANRYSVSPGVSVLFSATASDQDETLDSDNYAWSATIGTFSGSLTGLSANWIAPSENAPATITFTVTDGGGLVSRSKVHVIVGTGIYVPNNPPTISSITSSSTDGNHYGTLSYSLTASATDIDGNNLTYTWTATSSASAGTLSGSGKTVTWLTPDVNAATNVTITVSVTDGKDSASLSRTFSVTKDPDIEGNTAPATVTISLPAPSKLFVPGEQITFSGSATDYDPTSATYVTMAASALKWELLYPNATVITMASGYSSFSYTLPTDAGTFTVRLTATDKYQASTSSTRQFRINSAPNKPLISMNKTNPIQIGTEITFSGSATDTEDGTIAAASLTWKFPAPIGTRTGNTIATSTIPEGTHLIELSAKDSKGAVSASATLQVIVSNTGPTMTIASPADGSAVVGSQSVAISGSGTGIGGAAVAPSTMVWQLWRTGVATETIASETAGFNYTFDNVGEHVITLTGKDSADKTGTAQSRFTVNATPSVSLTLPASGTRFDLNAEITFAANLTDSPGEEPYLIASWASSIDGHMASGVPPLKYSDLSSGSHVITCEVINTRSKLSTSTSTMILVNTLPVGTLTYNIATYADGPNGRPIFMSTNSSMNIPMTMTTYDAEIGGEVPPENIKWFFIENNVEVPFATGKTVTTQLFPVGLASITVRIYDSFAENFEDQASATYRTGFQVWQSRLLSVGLTADSMTSLHTTGTGAGVKAYIAGYKGADSVVNTFDYNDGLNPFLEFTKDYVLATTTPGLAFEFITVDAAVTDKDNKIIALGTQAGDNHYLIHDIASTTVQPYALPSSVLNGATSLAMHPSDLTMGYLTVGSNKLLKFSPASKLLEETILSADGTPFNGLSRVRSIAGGPLVGKVFVADRVNNRVVRYLDYSLGSPVITSASAPIDVAVSGNYLLVLENSGKVSVHYIDSTGQSSFVMRFGGTVAGGAFVNVKGICCSGKDLFILEAGASNRIHLIRSGMTSWFTGS